MHEKEIKYCKIGNVSAIIAIIGALFFWGLTFEFAVGKIGFFGALVSALFSVAAVITGIVSFIIGKKDHSKRYATFAVLAGCIFSFFTVVPLVMMIKSANQKAEMIHEIETSQESEAGAQGTKEAEIAELKLEPELLELLDLTTAS